MMNRADLERLLVEISPIWADAEDGKEVADWLEQNNISEEAFDSVANSIWSIVVESLVGAMKDDEPELAISSIIAGIHLAFFVGWEGSKQYAPKRDMSQH